MAVSFESPNASTRLLCVVVTGLVAGRLIVTSSPGLGLLVISAFGLMVLPVVSAGLTRSWGDSGAAARILRWTMASFALHLFLGMIIINTSAVNFFGPDALSYDGIARLIVSHWTHGGPLPRLPGGKEGYYYLLASIYWLSGPSKWAGVACNAMLAAALIPIVSDTAHRLFGSTTVKYVPYLFVLVPGMLLWPAQLLKEAPYLFLLALAANCTSRLIHRYSPLPLLMLAFLLPCLLLFRAQTSFAIMTGMMAGVALGRRKLAGGVIGGLVVTALVAVVVASGIGAGGYQTARSTDLQQANDVRRGLSRGVSSGFGSDVDVSKADQALRFLPLGVVSAVLGPFPWQLRGGRQVVVLPDVVAWWWLCVGLWWGLRVARVGDRRWLVIVAPAVATIMVIALSVGNYGTLVRERMQVLVLVAPIIALGFAARSADRSERPLDALDA